MAYLFLPPLPHSDDEILGTIYKHLTNVPPLDPLLLPPFTHPWHGGGEGGAEAPPAAAAVTSETAARCTRLVVERPE